jgi:hypothetical protein
LPKSWNLHQPCYSIRNWRFSLCIFWWIYR